MIKAKDLKKSWYILIEEDSGVLPTHFFASFYH